MVEVDKSYSKDWMVKGRFKVELFDEMGIPINPLIRNSNLELKFYYIFNNLYKFFFHFFF